MPFHVFVINVKLIPLLNYSVNLCCSEHDQHAYDKHVMCPNTLLMLIMLLILIDWLMNIFYFLSANLNPQCMIINIWSQLKLKVICLLNLWVVLLKVVLLCYDMQITIWSHFLLSSLSQCSILGLELSCIKPTVRCSQVGWMGDSANNQVPRVECLCLSLNGLSHLLQRMNMRCLRCQHCKWILGLWAR